MELLTSSWELFEEPPCGIILVGMTLYRLLFPPMQVFGHLQGSLSAELGMLGSSGLEGDL